MSEKESNGGLPLMTQSQFEESPMNEKPEPEKIKHICYSISLSRDAEVPDDGDENVLKTFRRHEYTPDEIMHFAVLMARRLVIEKNFSVLPEKVLEYIIHNASKYTIDEEDAEEV